MESASERSGDGGSGLNEDKRSEHSIADDKETLVEENKKRPMVEAESSEFLAKKKKVDDQLETTKAQMNEVREENKQLKMNLNKIMNEYRALEIQFHNMVKQGTKKHAEKGNDNFKHPEIIEESDVSLSLGRVPSNPRNDEKVKVSKPLKDEDFKEDLSLGLDCKFETSKSGSTTEGLPNNIPSPVNSSEVSKEEGKETWPPSKTAKTVRDNTDHDEVAQQTPAKKTRVCVRARCDTPTMNDGCQWRKYGQKIAKGNPCPRAYYRCTVAPTCPVRKQVQRCVDDMSILITTYEGTHNHTLPLSATAMASTTSAAASMLLSGSSSSTIGSMPSTTTTNNNNLNFYLSSDGSKSNQLYLSNPTLSTSSQSHPTITLDLTSNPGSSSSPFVRFNNQPTRYSSSTSLSFSSPETNTMSWNNNHNFLNYSSHQPYNTKNNLSSTVNFGRPQNMYQTYMQNNNSADISAATKAITTNPTFQSALAAALSSFIGGIGSTQVKQGDGENLGSQKMKWAEMFPTSSTLPSTSNINGCASSFLNKTPTKTQTESLMLLSSPLPVSSTSKSASASPRDNSDNTN